MRNSCFHLPLCTINVFRERQKPPQASVKTFLQNLVVWFVFFVCFKFAFSIYHFQRHILNAHQICLWKRVLCHHQTVLTFLGDFRANTRALSCSCIIMFPRLHLLMKALQPWNVDVDFFLLSNHQTAWKEMCLVQYVEAVICSLCTWHICWSVQQLGRQGGDQSELLQLLVIADKVLLSTINHKKLV